MNTNIKTFLQVVKDGNLSTASKNLYVSQSTVSSRIKQLEQELNMTLFYRQKGQKEVELTEMGKQYLVLAEQLQSIHKDIDLLQKNTNYKTITIGSVDSINNFTFLPFYKQMLQMFPNLNLEIKTHHSDQIHTLIMNQLIDIGFVFRRLPTQNIIATNLFSEPMQLVANKASSYDSTTSIKDLKRNNEIYLEWNPEYVQWHHQNWNDFERPYILVDTGSMIPNYIADNKQAWSIVPKSVALSFSHNENISVYDITPSPPHQHCYMITSKYPKYSRIESINLIQSNLRTFLMNSSWIDPIESPK